MNSRKLLMGVVAAAVLAWPMIAAAPDMGPIRHSVPFTIDITPEVGNVGATAVTFMSMRTDRIKAVNNVTIPPGGPSVALTDTLGANVVHFDVFIYPPRNGLLQFRLTQGATVFTHDVVGDVTLVFDVVP
jgi:hypothetical protein